MQTSSQSAPTASVGQQSGVFEAHVGQFPQDVIQQDEAAIVNRTDVDIVTLALSPDDVIGRLFGGARPTPIQIVMTPQASASAHDFENCGRIDSADRQHDVTRASECAQ